MEHMWIKERALEFDDEDNSTKRIYLRLHVDGFMYFQQQSDYQHTLPFELQRKRLNHAFSQTIRYSSGSSTPGAKKYTVDEFNREFEDMLQRWWGSKEVVEVVN